MRSSNKRLLIQSIIAFFCILSLSILIEVVGFNFDLLRSGAFKEGSTAVSLEDVGGTGFSYNDGVIYTNSDAQLVVEVPGNYKYIGKFEYGYKAENNFTEQLTVNTVNGYGKDEVLNIVNGSHNKLTRSVINVHAYTSEVFLSLPKDIEITYITVNNKIVFSPVRFAFIFFILAAGYFLVAFRKYLAKKIEVGFLVLALGLGSFFILSAYTAIPSWDEQIRFRETYTYSQIGETVSWTQAALDIVRLENPGVGQRASLEESRDVVAYLNSMHDRGNPVDVESKPLLMDYSRTGYLTQSIMFGIADSLQLPFSVAFYMGEFGNLLLYALAIFFAIRIIPIGKRVLTVVGLMPTPLFLASNYSYDPTVTACLILGFSVFVSELLQPEKRFSIGNAAVFTVFMLFGSFSKAVYIPLILLALLLPKQKFATRAQMYIFKGGIIFLFLLMMSTFMLPMLGGNRAGDPRGGDTDASEQMMLLLTHPFTFIKVFCENVFSSFFGKFFGANPLMDFAYLGSSTIMANEFEITFLSVSVLVFTMITDTESTVGRSSLTGKQRWALLVVLAVIVAMIWSALYLSFTPVGSTQIAGVQGRYFIPLILPLYLIVRPTKIKCSISPDVCNLIALAIPAYITGYMLFFLQISRYCF